jgi:hypothetical protein
MKVTFDVSRVIGDGIGLVNPGVVKNVTPAQAEQFKRQGLLQEDVVKTSSEKQTAKKSTAPIKEV